MTSAGNETEYAFWTDEAGSFKVHYSLPLFHEIDFQANEGYRRIPHGGVEIGGVLYGKRSQNAISIEAFRPIDCEHATGPSFNLSERDLEQLAASLAAAPGDDELKAYVPLGWFIAHTRNPLRISEREAQLFNQFFPEPGSVTLLIKPERFQPTRFGFAVRSADKSFKTDVSDSAIILPLPGRAGSAAKGLVPSIPAPAAKTPSQPKQPPAQNQKAEASPSPVQQQIAPETPQKPPQQEQKNEVTSVRPTAVIASKANLPQEKPLPETVSAMPVPLLPSAEEIKKRRAENVTQAKPITQEETVTRPLGSSRNQLHGRLLLVLLLAALLGCGVGYWAYLQLPPAEIDLRVHKYGQTLLVQWTPVQTQDSGYAAIRIDDGLALPLTAEQKRQGQIDIKQTSDNMKIELIAQHWIRDSRGIVRFVSMATPRPR